MSDPRGFRKGGSMVLEIREDSYGNRQMYAIPEGGPQLFHPIHVTPVDVGPLVSMLDQMLTAAIQREDDTHGFVPRLQAIVHTALRQLQATFAERETKELRAEQNAERARWEGEIGELRAEWEKERHAWRVERAELWQARAQLERQAREAREADPESAPEVPA